MNDQKVEKQISDAMDELTANIDVASQIKLNQARDAALNAHVRRKWTPVLPLAGMALAGVLAVALIWHQPSGEVTPDTQEIMWIQDLDLLATEAEPEFYQDLEFLAWLDENELMENEI